MFLKLPQRLGSYIASSFRNVLKDSISSNNRILLEWSIGNALQAIPRSADLHAENQHVDTRNFRTVDFRITVFLV